MVNMKLVRNVWLSFFLFALPSCLGWFLEKPNFTLTEILVTHLSPQEVHLLFWIQVQNPNSFDLKIQSMEYAIYLNDRKTGEGHMDQEVKIDKFSSTLVQIPLQAKLSSLGNVLGAFLTNQDLQYKIDAAVVVKAGWGRATIPFSKSGEIKIKK
jgi:LEA14-like dessication related protein